jgi:ADP-heptose:LPS heptosyltransferase
MKENMKKINKNELNQTNKDKSQEVKKILIIRNDHIGDLALSTGVFREIKNSIPNSEITLIVSNSSKSIIEKNKNIDKIIILDMPKKNLKSIFNYIKMSLKLKKEKFDVGIDLRGSLMNSFFLMWLPGIKKRIGKSDNYTEKYLCKIISLFLTCPVKTGYYVNDTHITQDNINIINAGLGINSKNIWPEIIFDKDDEKEVRDLLDNHNIKKYVCLCPFVNAGAEAKQWPKENYLEIIKWMRKFDFDIFILGTKDDEKDLNEAKNVNKRVKTLINFDLRKMAVLFKNSLFTLGNDGGPMHIAWISKAKTIELLPRYHPILGKNKFSPLKNTIVLFAEKGNMDSLKIEDVKEAILKMI